MTTPQYIVAGIISALAFGLIVLRYCYPPFPVDATSLGLFGLAVLPWLTLFFKKFKVPGIVEGEAHDRAQGSTPPTPPKMATEKNEKVPEAQPQRFKGLPASAQKILRTLWRYQKQLYKEDYSRRWTFAIFPTAPGYPEYLAGLSVLLRMNLISMNPENHQSALTNEGIILMESLTDDDTKGDFYVF